MNIQKDDGQLCSCPDDVSEVIVAYYQNLLQSATTSDLEETTQSIHTTISEEMNLQLSTEFMAWELQDAIKQMAPFKASSLDGMPLIFY